METIKADIIFLLNEGVENILPPARDNDTCFDMVAKSINVVGESISYGDRRAWKRIDYIEYDTGIKIAPSDKYVFSMIYSRSSVSKYNLALANSVGIVDNGYRDTIRFRFKYVWQPEDFIVMDDLLLNGFVFGIINEEKIYKVGDKIGQIKFDRKNHVSFYPVETLPSSDRGEGGFGSTGK
jgi:dUTPase